MSVRRRLFQWSFVAATLVLATPAMSLALESEGNSRYTIKDVMITAYKQKLATKVIQGQANDDEKRRLLTLYEALANSSPPRGPSSSWQQKTTQLVQAAQAAIEGQSEAPLLLKKTMECGACHTKHK